MMGQKVAPMPRVANAEADDFNPFEAKLVWLNAACFGSPVGPVGERDLWQLRQ